MNPVLILTRNNLELTKKCVESIRAQDISTEIMVIDNGSSDDTPKWLQTTEFDGFCWLLNHGVSYGWNWGLRVLFAENKNADHVLVLNNDVVLPPWFYRALLKYKYPFVTGIAVDTMPTGEPEWCPVDSHPDFSAFLITRQCWETVGEFDERMMLYSSDQDYHLRGWFAGVPMMKANVPYYHVNSQTLKRASEEERAWINAQADKDRKFLSYKWGVSPGGSDYQALFSPENFGSRREPACDTNGKATQG